MPVRIQRSRARGWRMPAGALYVGRPGPWGNPFDFRRPDHCWSAIALGSRADPAGRHAASVLAYRGWIVGQVAVKLEAGFYFGVEPVATSPAIDAGEPPTLDAIRQALAGHDLVCWCRADQPCHGDVLLDLANW